MRPSVATSICKAVAANDAATLAAMLAARNDMQAELDAAYDRIEELEGIVGLRAEFPLAFKLRPMPRKIFGLLLSSAGWVSMEAIEIALYGHLPECDQPRNPRAAIKVHVRNMRIALNAVGIEVDTIFGPGGYWLPPAMKQKARTLIDAAAARRVHSESPTDSHCSMNATDTQRPPMTAASGVVRK